MKSTIWKSTFREIKQSLGRFLAIVAIIALGVGLFAGLKMTQPDMMAMTQNYFDEANFYDYRLLSTVGFGKEDVQTFAEMDGVEAAEGALQFDIMCEDTSGNNYVLKAHSITEDVNKLTVVEGRLPERADECVVDANAYDSSWIGKKITLSKANEEEDLDHFSYQEYEITGIVQSPLYIQFERGTTALGSGTVSGFFYLLPEGFADDYYTEIYVAFAPEFSLYSDAYEAYIEGKQDEWETAAFTAAEDRYNEFKTEAEQELADANAELEEKRTEAEQELADAKEQLDDAAEQIADAEEQISDAKAELEAAPAELDAKEAELLAAEQTIQEKEAELQAGAAALGSGIPQEQIAIMQQQIAAGQAELDAQKQQIEDGKAAITAAREQITDGLAELEEKEAELADARAEYEDGLAEYEDALAEFNAEIADAEQQIADGEKEIEEMVEPDAYVLGRDTNVGYVCFESDSGIVDGIANVFPVFFFLVAALVCMTTMNRMVEEQRTQIGVLKALGYSESTIMAKYIFYSGSAALLGAVVGYVLGTWLFPKVIWFAYGILYRIDDLVYLFDWKLALISLIASLLCSVGTTWVSCRLELKEVAAELMRPKAPKAGKRVIFEKMPFIWKRLKFLQKVSVRNIFRYKKRFFMMIVGISGCTALLVTGFGVGDSVKNVANQQYTEIQTYDASVTYSDPVSAEMERELQELIGDGISDYAFVLEKSMDLETDDGTKGINLIVMDPKTDMTPYLSLHSTKDEKITAPKNGEAVICQKIADTYDIAIGDTITLYDEDMKTIDATVSGICENFVYSYVYLNAETYEEDMGEAATYKTAYVNINADEDAHLVGTKLMNLDKVTSVIISEDTLARFDSMLGSMDLIVFVIVLCAAGLAFIVLYNLTNINITERVREIATIKVLGFYEKETAAYVFRENNILSFIGALVGLVLGYFFHAFVMSQIKIDIVSFDVHIRPASYIYSVVLTLVFAWLVGKMMKRKLDQISMTESLKSVD